MPRAGERLAAWRSSSNRARAAANSSALDHCRRSGRAGATARGLGYRKTITLNEFGDLRSAEIERFTRQRAVNERFLTSARQGQHVIAYLPKEQADLNPGNFQILDQ